MDNNGGWGGGNGREVGRAGGGGLEWGEMAENCT